jgi:hypothetical protein
MEHLRTYGDLLAEVEALKLEVKKSYDQGRADEQKAIMSYAHMLSEFSEYAEESGLDQLVVDVAYHDLHLKDAAWRDDLKARVGSKPWPYTTIQLDDYQKANLKWLIELCGYPYGGGVSPFTFANTGDWLGEIYLRLGESKRAPNMTKESVVESIRSWRRSLEP